MGMKKFYVGIKAVIKDDRGYLVLKAKKGHMDIPGGRIDGDESFEQTLRREVSEELPGTVIKSIRELAGAYRVEKDIEQDTGLVLLYFLVKAKVPEKVILSKEHASYFWVNREEEIPKGLNSEISEILRKLTK